MRTLPGQLDSQSSVLPCHTSTLCSCLPWQVQAALTKPIPVRGLLYSTNAIPETPTGQQMVLQCIRTLDRNIPVLQAPHSAQESSAPEKAQTASRAVQAAKQLAAAALASLQIAALPFAAELAQPAPAAAVLNSPNARIARRFVLAMFT